VRKKKLFFLVFCDAAGEYCGGFLSCLWWPVSYVVIGGVAAAIGKKRKRKEDAGLMFGLLKVDLCSTFESVVAVFEVAGLFCFSPASFGELRRRSGELPVTVYVMFSVFFFCFLVLPACSACFRPVLKLRRSSAFSGESLAMLRRSFL
jgi:hypothetical protein